MAFDKDDYLIMDMGEFICNLYAYPAKEGWISGSKALKDKPDRYTEPDLIPSEYEVIASHDIDKDVLDRMLGEYCSQLRLLYEPDKIILIEVKAGGHHIIDDGNLCAAEDSKVAIINTRISYAYNYMKDHLEGIHLIEFPRYVSMDPKHVSGRSLFHFVKEYYDYKHEAVDIIGSGDNDLEFERILLEDLRLEYEKKLFEKYYCFK